MRNPHALTIAFILGLVLMAVAPKAVAQHWCTTKIDWPDLSDYTLYLPTKSLSRTDVIPMLATAQFTNFDKEQEKVRTHNNLWKKASAQVQWTACRVDFSSLPPILIKETDPNNLILVFKANKVLVKREENGIYPAE